MPLALSGGGIIFMIQLALGAVDNYLMAMGGELCLGELGVPLIEEEVSNIAVHR